MALFGYKPLIIRSYGKCKIKYYDAEADKVVEKEITEEEFLEYKEQWAKHLKTNFTVADYNDTSKTDNPEVFTYDWEYDKPSNTVREEINIPKNKVVYFSKIVMRDITGKEEPPVYEINLRDNVKIYLPNEDIYNSFCKWMKG